MMVSLMKMLGVDDTFDMSKYDVFDFEHLRHTTSSEFRFFAIVKCFVRVHSVPNMRFAIIPTDLNVSQHARLYWDTPLVKIYKLNSSPIFLLKVTKYDKIKQ